MESSKKADVPVPPAAGRSPAPARFTPAALARVLNETLHIGPERPLYVAYSGGMDSHVLLHALVQLRAWRVGALHVDHGLQPASGEWARHCASVCAVLGVPYYGEQVVVTGIAERGPEDAARQARYGALARRLPAQAVLLTGHHEDDQAETVLLQLLRGAGPAGLAAMPPITPFAQGHLARPLLDFGRRTLADYAAAEGLRWIDDTSNRDTGFARNYLRHRLWPVMLARWPQAAGRIASTARHQAEAARLLEDLADIDAAGVGDAQGALHVPRLLLLAPERQVNLVRHWARVRGMAPPPERVLRQILQRVRQSPATRHAVVRWRDTEVCRYRERLVIRRAHAPPPVGWEEAWNMAEPIEIAGSGWYLRALPTVGTGLARARVAGHTVQVRLRRGGERCRVRGHTHKVKKLLQEAGIPPWERARLPLVYVDGELAAVGDRWICEPYAAQRDEAGIALVLEPGHAG